ncbi:MULTISPECIES: TraB/VirB10 family protein [unclassified Dyella]|uniref:TraB/VirB10 family protein n=1 Tax=Dyella sp. ASV21 TaxID=2795114 RepID=UPI0018EC1F2A|nr:MULTISPECIES: TraB/VirB10 family protein [unclassified Dyella]
MAMPKAITDRWEKLNPKQKQWLTWGAMLSVLFVIGYYIFFTPPKQATHKGPTQIKMANELMPSNAARDLGMSSLAAGVKDAQRDQKQLGQTVNQLKLQSDARNRQGADGQERSAAQKTQTELVDLRKQVEDLKSKLEQGGGQQVQAGQAANGQHAGQAGAAMAPMAGGSATSVGGGGAVTLREVGRGTPSTGHATAANADPSAAGVPNKPGTATPAETAKSDAKVPTQYMPSGSLIEGVNVTGMDAPTGKQAMKDPVPMLIRVKKEAILPNRFRADVRECFIVSSGHGDLASERAYIRSVSISCVRKDKRVIDIAAEMVAIGPDGKAGIRGRLVTKQGQLIAKAGMAGVAQGFAQAFSGSNYRMNFASDNTDYGTAFEQGAGQGVGSAFDRIAKYYLDLADQMMPVIEIDAGQRVTFMLVKGVSMGVVK